MLVSNTTHRSLLLPIYYGKCILAIELSILQHNCRVQYKQSKQEMNTSSTKPKEPKTEDMYEWVMSLHQDQGIKNLTTVAKFGIQRTNFPSTLVALKCDQFPFCKSKKHTNLMNLPTYTNSAPLYIFLGKDFHGIFVRISFRCIFEFYMQLIKNVYIFKKCWFF